MTQWDRYLALTYDTIPSSKEQVIFRLLSLLFYFQLDFPELRFLLLVTSVTCVLFPLSFT